MCSLMVLGALAFSWWPGRATGAGIACAAPAPATLARDNPEDGCARPAQPAQTAAARAVRTSRGPYMSRDEMQEAAARDEIEALRQESASRESHPWPMGSTGPSRYTVQQGDTLWEISVNFGVSVGMIMTANDLDGYSVLSPGMELELPASNQRGAAVTGPFGPVVAGSGLHFVASISQQRCWLFRDGVAVETWTCSTGRDDSPSIPGNYTVQSKINPAWFAGAESWMPYWMGIYDAPGYENGIHGLPYASDTGEKFWTDKIGVPITFGCVMLEDVHARTLFDVAYVGMPVTVLR